MRWLVVIIALAWPASALAQDFGYNPYDPGATQSPPGPGCQIGTSGCFPSAPPGPLSAPGDYGAPQNQPPQYLNPSNVPFFGVLPGYGARPAPPPAPPPPESTGPAESGASSLSEQGSPSGP